MELKRFQNNPILTPNKNNKWEAEAVFNCSVTFDKNVFHLVYRAIASGFSPRPKGGYKNYISSIGYATSRNGIHFQRYSKPLIKPEYEWERFGCEDPRVTKFGDKYFIFYTALSSPASSGRGVRIALATTKDFRNVTKHGIVGPNIKSKAATIFPEKINNKIVMLFKNEAKIKKAKDCIQIAFFDNEKQLLEKNQDYWTNYIKNIDNSTLLAPTMGWEGKEVEVGAPPIKTSKGWLIIYAGIAKEKVWSVGAALLDLKDPKKVIARSKKPILKPEKKYETEGLVPNVTFPEGAVIVKNKLFVYYGAADKTCCLARCNLNDLLKSLL